MSCTVVIGLGTKEGFWLGPCAHKPAQWQAVLQSSCVPRSGSKPAVHEFGQQAQKIDRIGLFGLCEIVSKRGPATRICQRAKALCEEEDVEHLKGQARTALLGHTARMSIISSLEVGLRSLIFILGCKGALLSLPSTASLATVLTASPDHHGTRLRWILRAFPFQFLPASCPWPRPWFRGPAWKDLGCTTEFHRVIEARRLGATNCSQPHDF